MQDEFVPAGWKQALEACNRFMAEEIMPYALGADQEADPGFVSDKIRQLAEIGLLDILVPDKRGVTDMGLLTACLVVDILARGCPSMATALAYHFAVEATLLEWGSQAQIQQWLEPFTTTSSKERRLSTCIFPDYGSPSVDDKAGLTIEEGSKGLLLDGMSSMVPVASYASSFIVFARPRGNLVDGALTCLVLPSDQRGIELGKKESFNGLNALPIHRVLFHQVEVGKGCVIGEHGKAKPVLSSIRNLLHLFLAASVMGVARAAYYKALTYDCERHQHGNIIIHPQEIQGMLNKMLASLYAGTALYIHSIFGDSMGGICSKPHGDLVKFFCTNAALEVVFDAIQIVGSHGCMHDHSLGKLLREAKRLQNLEGPNHVLHIDTTFPEVTIQHWN